MGSPCPHGELAHRGATLQRVGTGAGAQCEGGAKGATAAERSGGTKSHTEPAAHSHLGSHVCMNAPLRASSTLLLHIAHALL